ncbi:MAG: hypothetical protein HYW25_02480 [Candidatus Aenigmarchaeota archaeon]|nr:hypothetical protein [Candidatus Aenigmarchaeota archaeon]
MLLTLDSSCFEPQSECLRELIELRKQNKIVLQIAYPTIIEFNRLFGSKKTKKIMKIVEDLNLIEMLPEPDNSDEFESIVLKVLKIHSDPDRRGLSFEESMLKSIEKRYPDAEIFAQHVLSKADFFITRDKRGFINGGRKENWKRNSIPKFDS